MLTLDNLRLVRQLWVGSKKKSTTTMETLIDRKQWKWDKCTHLCHQNIQNGQYLCDLYHHVLWQLSSGVWNVQRHVFRRRGGVRSACIYKCGFVFHICSIFSRKHRFSQRSVSIGSLAPTLYACFLSLFLSVKAAAHSTVFVAWKGKR